MATDLQTQPFAIQPISFDDVPRAAIEQLAAELLPLTIRNQSDKRGLKRVQAGRERLHELQRKIERRRKELKADSLEYGRKVDEAARTLQSLIEPIAGYLQQLEHDHARERTQLEREAAETRVAMIRRRLALLAECGWSNYTPADVGPYSEPDFEKLLEHARANPKPVAVRAVDLGMPPAGIAKHYDSTPANTDGAALAAKLTPLAKASQAEDFSKLLHVANLVALIEVPQVMTQAGAEAAGEVATLLNNCAERIRAAANLITNAR